jgi:hypothetical protein
MRSNVFAVVAVMALVASLPARAQSWIEFQDLAWGVGINFPHEPVGEDIEYMSSEDRIVPGRVWTAETEGGHYSLTAISFENDPTDSLTAVFFAATALRAKGVATYDNYHALDGVPGWMMSVTGTDGRLIQSFSLFLNQRLYIAEGSVAPGNPPPSNFQQSITVLNAVGDRIQLNN